MASVSKGHGTFVEKYGLRSGDQQRLVDEVIARIEKEDLQSIRFVFADQHGILRGKTIMAAGVKSAFTDGISMTTTLLAKDTSHHTAYPVFSAGGGFEMAEMTGGGDFLMIADPTTFRILPWAEKTGWVQCDIYFGNGSPVPFCTRNLCRNALGNMRDNGFDLMAGLEVEFHLLVLENPHLQPEHSTHPATAPEVSLLTHGFNYLTEIRYDQLEPILEIIRVDLDELGLPPRSMELEFGPSQCEMTFAPTTGLATADNMVLFRSAVKQIARRQGLHATFMCRPGLPNLFSSGWHLHQSLIDTKTASNVFTPADDGILSETGFHYVGGILEHARAASVFTTPTINGYKRYRPNSLAPDRVTWAKDNRGVMVRAVGGGPATRIENRIGEPAANPYLYLASQAVAGLDGITRKTDPGSPTEAPYRAEATPLPASLMEAVAALRESDLFREQFGATFVDYLITLKEFEISRFLSSVTDWEHREYFEIF